MNIFERYLTLWVGLCMAGGIALGAILPAPFQMLGRATVAQINIPIAILVWLMIVPMLIRIDPAALFQVGRHWRGIAVTLITDPYCDWAHGVVSELLTVETDLNHFWDTTSVMASLVGLAVNGVFKELGAGVERRMEKVAGLYNELVGHTGFAPGTAAARRNRASSSSTARPRTRATGGNRT